MSPVPVRCALVTGGAGFIGSQVVDRLLAGGAERVVVFDAFTTGRREHLAAHAGDGRLRVVTGDVLDLPALTAAMAGCDTLFHFQANADVRGGPARPRIDLEQNTVATWNVLDAMRTVGARTFAMASSATVYGEPVRFPTPEDEPLVQTSLYGASKLAGEAMAQAYAEYYGMRAFAFRFVSCTGPRYWHGVLADFVAKLRANPAELAVLGDGSQRKSFLDVRDAVAGIFLALERAAGAKHVFNLGHEDIVTVREVARIVLDELGLAGAVVRYGAEPRGWPGDSPLVHLDTGRMRALGWAPRYTIEQTLRETVRELALDCRNKR
ncbi:MAG: hypothetical protein RL376_1085 [Verrucomicrobiota bacterium]|jgi:UDP-glucose 4-epimerase